MVISEMIAQLEALKAEHGDLEVFRPNNREGLPSVWDIYYLAHKEVTVLNYDSGRAGYITKMGIVME